MKTIQHFIGLWFPKTDSWHRVRDFILESGVSMTDSKDSGFFPGYSNIQKCEKPHHINDYIRYMEEQMFMLHDVLHQIFTMKLNVGKEEYVERQMYGEFFVFFLTEFLIIKEGKGNSNWKYHEQYIKERGNYVLIEFLYHQLKKSSNIIDLMFDIFILDKIPQYLKDRLETDIEFKEVFDKCATMFKIDYKNSTYNFNHVNLKLDEDYSMVGKSARNHVDFFEAVSKGALINKQRVFNKLTQSLK